MAETNEKAVEKDSESLAVHRYERFRSRDRDKRRGNPRRVIKIRRRKIVRPRRVSAFLRVFRNNHYTPV